MSNSPLFLVAFEHAHRSFKCMRLEAGEGDASFASPHWVVTMAGRPVWSFAASSTDTRDGVEAEVVKWWDAANRDTANRGMATRPH